MFDDVQVLVMIVFIVIAHSEFAFITVACVYVLSRINMSC